MRKFQSIVTTLPILTEASNLMGNRHEERAATLINVCAPFVEVVHSKGSILAAEIFPRLGFADTSILLSLDDQTTLLTDDVSLYLQALYDGRQAINFNHLRQFGNP